MKRFGEATLVAAGFVALAVGYFGLGIATSFVLLMLTGTLAAFGNGVIRPALDEPDHAAGRTAGAGRRARHHAVADVDGVDRRRRSSPDC